MLLRQLVAFQPSEAALDGSASRPYSRQRPVRWELNLDGAGRLRGPLVDIADPGDKAAKFVRAKLVPNVSRTVGIAPNLGADDIQYVLGWTDAKSQPARVP